jgi:hypothetical protein
MLLLLLSGHLRAQDEPTDVSGQIAHLIDFIAASPCSFIRNDDVYDGKAAAGHIRQKYDHYKDEIASAEDFIDRAASRSLLSGRPYQVHCPGVAIMPARDWLLLELTAYRARSGVR